MKQKTLALAMAAALTAGVLSGCAASAGGAQAPAAVAAAGSEVSANKISASGEGVINIAPDMAEIRISISTEGADAKTVKDENTEKYNQVVAFLKSQGIEESSIMTSDVYMNPQYDWQDNQNVVVGYTMETELTVSDIVLDQLGTLIDSAVDNGINGIRSVSYLSSEFDAKYNEALALAIENAKSKAEAMAQAGGVTLGGVVSVSEYGANTAARYTKSLSNGSVLAAGAPGASADTAMSMMPGELEITARVDVEFAIK